MSKTPTLHVINYESWLADGGNVYHRHRPATHEETIKAMPRCWSCDHVVVARDFNYCKILKINVSREFGCVKHKEPQS